MSTTLIIKIVRNPNFEENSTQTLIDNNSDISIQTDSENNLDQSSQTEIIIHSNSNCVSRGTGEDVWPEQKCFKANCAYSELHSNIRAENLNIKQWILMLSGDYFEKS